MDAFFTYSPIGHWTNVFFKMYVDDAFVKEASATTLSYVDMTFTKSLDQGMHRFAIKVTSTSYKLSPVPNLWLESSISENQLSVTPPLIIVSEGKGFDDFVEPIDSIEVTFEVKPYVF